MNSPRLEDFFKTYERLRDCLKVTKRAVDDGSGHLLDDTSFMGQSQTQASDWIDQVAQAADELAIVALWAWFERYLKEFIQAKVEVASSTPAAFVQGLQDRITEAIEYWRPKDLLDLFKSITDAHQIGNAKQIKDYRDWIAHRNPIKGEKATQAEPANAYALFVAIISAVEQAPAAEQP